MVSSSIFAGLALAAATALASPLHAPAAYAVKEVHPVPRAWTKLDRAPGDHVIDLDIALKQDQFDELERHIYEVSTPGHARYGQHLSREQVNELVKPAVDTSELVHAWLEDFGIDLSELSYSPAKDWIKISLPVSKIEKLLDTEYSIYEHEDGDRLVRTPSWSIPLHLHQHVMAIQPTNSFLRAAPANIGVSPLRIVDSDLATVPLQANIEDEDDTVAQACNVKHVTPRCLRVLYGTIKYKPGATNKNKVALTDYLGETNNRSDVNLFLQQFRPDAAGYGSKFPITVIAKGNNQQTPDTPAQLKAGKDVEGNLDAETIIGITYPTPLEAYTTGSMPPFKPAKGSTTNTNEPYMVWLHYILAQKSIPQVISSSYDDEEQTVPPSYAHAVCRGFAQLGARGVSLFFASGDSGVGSAGTCVSNDGSNKRIFIPNFPSSCPYVTSVGATRNFNPEVAAHDPSFDFNSGGGFSNYFPRPAYQEDAVPPYVKSLKDAYKGLYNASGRAYPDVSAQGQRYVVTWDGKNIAVDGTSAATPTFASVIALVNDALLRNNKTVLGFLNPWLYQQGHAALNDVTSGSAQGCGVPGFPARRGYDAVTGFGTPNFIKILQFLDLPQGFCPGAAC